jgi:outer membrane biosynthesis protein TonB
MATLEKYFPLTGTLLFHGLILVLLLLGVKSCNVSAVQKEEVQYESLSLAALGDFEPGEGEYVDLGSEAEAVQAANGDIEQVISDMEAQVETQGTTEPKPQPTQTNTNENTDNSPTPEQLEQEAKKNKINKLFSGGSQSSAGNTPGGTGIEGNPNGELGGKGEFGGGNNGTGVKWNLKGRGIAKKPSLEQKPQFEGTIYLNITVDAKGNVTAATVDPVKSKVAGEGFQQLAELAKRAAFATKFSVVEDTKKQVGSIVITFTLK